MEMEEERFASAEADQKRKADDDIGTNGETKDSVNSEPPQKRLRCENNALTTSDENVTDSEVPKQSEDDIMKNTSHNNKDIVPEVKLEEGNVVDRNNATEGDTELKTEIESSMEDGNMETAHESESTVKKSVDSQQESSMDPLAYTKAEEFTSEIFKIQIHQLPKFGYSDLKKRLISLGLKPHKFKSPRREVTYVCFRNEEDRQEALKKLNGHMWKGKKLEAKIAAPQADPFLEKRRQKGKQCSVVSATQEPQTFEEAQISLKKSVVPLWDVEYSKQLETKTDAMSSVLKKLTHQQLVREQFRRMESWKENGMPCPLLPIIPSPITSEYRNKNEFTIGYTQDGKTIKVGFRYGLYKHGTTSVGDCTNIGVVKPEVVPILQSFEKFVSESKWPPYLQQTGAGHWQTLTVRSFDSGDVMAMVDFHPRKLDKNELDEVKNSIREFYTSGGGEGVRIKSFYFRVTSQCPDGVPRLEKVYGEPYVYESLLGLKFRISPEAFFQVNTRATEKLYSVICDWCNPSESSTVLDICCGTGTIGLSIAKKVKQVIGVEMCQPAVEDAKENASINDITNVTYFCSKVEDVIGKMLASAFTTSPSSTPSSSSTSATSSSSDTPSSTQVENDVIAVVDPPRAGLHKSVIKMLRKTEEIKRLVYVSCNPDNAMENFVDLIRPTSSKLRGGPFTMVQAVPVDLFPGTKHCELVILFTR